MPIRFECPDCGTALKVKEEFIGRKIRCPHCDSVNKVTSDNEGSDDDEDDSPRSRTRSSSGASRSKPSRRSQPRRSRPNDDDDLEELPLSPNQKKKKAAQKSKAASGGKVPGWAIVAGSSLAGVLIIAVLVFIAMKPPGQAANAQAAGGEPEKAKTMQAQVDGPNAKLRMKFEMPLNWTSEGSLEDDLWPWATMKGQGQVIKLSSNRSLLGGAETMTAMGGAVEQLKTSHTLRGTKLQSENTEWVDGQLNTHEGKLGPVIWSDYEYKGVFSKGYGIRCTVNGPLMPCTLMIECGQSGRDKWRPTLLAIAESIHFVKIKADGQEDRDDLEFGPGDEIPNADQAMPKSDQADTDGDPEDK